MIGTHRSCRAEYSRARGFAKSKGPNYSSEEIASRVAAAPVRFDWLAQVSGPGDVIDDPSVAWPETRRLVRLGTIDMLRMVDDRASADKATLFGPTNLVPRIETADPMLEVRDAVYLLSFRDRQ
jgi:catalase